MGVGVYKHLPNAFNLISSRIRPIVSALKRQVRPGNQLAKSLSAPASSVVPARHSVCALPICMFTRSLVFACVCVGVLACVLRPELYHKRVDC